MNRVRIQVTPGFARSARELGRMLEIPVLKIKDSDYRPRAGDIVINYGSATVRWPDPGVVWLNHPNKVRAKTDKRSQLATLDAADVNVPDFTTDRDFARRRWRDDGVFCRADPESYGGRGVLYVQGRDFDDLPVAPLYTCDVGIETEYRIHVFKDTVIGVRKKLRYNEYPENKIRSYSNGYFYSVKPAGRIPSDACVQAVNACRALGLDFGGVDIGIDRDGTPWVFEVNAAPGLDGPDFENYAHAFGAWIEEQQA